MTDEANMSNDHVRKAENNRDAADDLRQENEVKRIASFLISAIKNGPDVFWKLEGFLKKDTIPGHLTQRQFVKILSSDIDDDLEKVAKKRIDQMFPDWHNTYDRAGVNEDVKVLCIEYIAKHKRGEEEWPKVSPEFLAEVLNIVQPDNKISPEFLIKIRKIQKMGCSDEEERIIIVKFKFKEKIESFSLSFDDFVGMERLSYGEGIILNTSDYKNCFEKARIRLFGSVEWDDGEEETVRGLVKSQVGYDGWKDKEIII